MIIWKRRRTLREVDLGGILDHTIVSNNWNETLHTSEFKVALPKSIPSLGTMKIK